MFAKAKSVDIQAAINNHMCMDCSQYTYIFEVIDEKESLEHKRALNLKAVNKYRATKDTEKIRLTYLKSVRKNQEKSEDKYKTAHFFCKSCTMCSWSVCEVKTNRQQDKKNRFRCYIAYSNIGLHPEGI